jgi:hypothetical protein
MATSQGIEQVRLPSDSRIWQEFAYHSYARIVARKHGIVVPDVDLSILSDEELERRVRLVSELAHLPPA